MGRALTVTFAVAVLVAGGVFHGLVVLLDFRVIDRSAMLVAKTPFDLVKLSFGVFAGAGALVTLVVAYRRQRVDSSGTWSRGAPTDVVPLLQELRGEQVERARAVAENVVALHR
ncbi:hypothetical protein [Streptomyces sp. NPDC055243]|uniref:hypothetical protein n=1 Tax=Streptomyces sp. NPDC055243 TaxID=3365720 RepID=UPI0037CFA413